MLARCLCAAVLVLLVACTPTLDWREVRPEGSDIQALFPCKPTTRSRDVPLAGASTRLTLVACQAGGATFALSFADAADPTRVGALMKSLGDASAANLGATPTPGRPFQVRGMTPNPLAQRIPLAGKGPDNAALTLETGLFSRGTRVYQATVMAPRPDAAAVETFFDNLGFPG